MITTNRKAAYQLFPSGNACFADEAEFNEIVRHHSPKLLFIVTCLTKNRQTAEDIVQETFLRLWEKRMSLTPENVGGWLYRVAWNLSMGHIKKEAGRTKVHALWSMLQQHTTGAEEHLLQKENTAVFKKIYARLPEKQQTVYHLSKVVGCSRDEIAQQLNISPHTVKNHLASAVRFMKEHIAAIALFVLFFVFNNIFFNRTSTKTGPGYLYTKQQPANGNPAFSFKPHVPALMRFVIK